MPRFRPKVFQQNVSRATSGGEAEIRTRSYGHSNHIDNQRCEPNESGKVGCFFVSCGDSSAPLDPAEESFDLVAMFVECLVVSLLDSSCRMGLDADFGFQLSTLISQGIGVVRCIGNHGADSPLRQNGHRRSPCGASPLCPGVRTKSINFPLRPVTACILVVNVPRLRPRHRRCRHHFFFVFQPLPRRSNLMRFDNR